MACDRKRRLGDRSGRGGSRWGVPGAASLCAAALCACAPAPPATDPEAVRDDLDASEIQALARQILASSERVYASDYLSFVGRDAQGFVALALDNNRGRDGEAYQAEHFAILHDQDEGWIELPVPGAYPNPERELYGIPDSAALRFLGTPQRGLRVQGSGLSLDLETAPIELDLVRAVGQRALFAMGASAATLRWRGRVLEGRVIHEYLVVRDFNRLSGFDLSALFGSIDFQGLYLRTERGEDVYVHRTNGALAGLGPAIARLGFLTERGALREAEQLELRTTRTAQGLGLFRWPVAWRATWGGETGETAVDVEVVDFRRVGSFLLGGFGMAIVRGTLERGGERVPVYGWAELILWRA